MLLLGPSWVSVCLVRAARVDVREAVPTRGDGAFVYDDNLQWSSPAWNEQARQAPPHELTVGREDGR